MRLLHLLCYCEPEITSSSYLIDDRNEAFAREGIETVVFTPTPTRGVSKEIRKEYKKRRTETKQGGMRIIHRFPLFREGSNTVMRALRYMLMCLMEFFLAIFAKDARRCEALFVFSTPPIQGAMAAMVKKVRGLPIIFVLDDIFPDSLVGTGIAKKDGFLWKIGRVIEDFTYKNVDKIIVISEDFKRNIMAKGVPEKKIEIIYNWVDAQVVPVADDKNTLFEEFDISREKFRVVYAGNLGNAQNINIILDSAALLLDKEDIEFVIFGSGGLEDKIRLRIEKEGLVNVRLLPFQPYKRVSQVYSLGNVGIVSCKAGLGGSAMPSKTWNIMAAARPVIVSFDDGELRDIIEHNHCGIFTPADNKDAFCNAILRLHDDKKLCQEMGRNGQTFVIQHLTKEVGTQQYIQAIKSIAKSNKSKNEKNDK